MANKYREELVTARTPEQARQAVKVLVRVFGISPGNLRDGILTRRRNGNLSEERARRALIAVVGR